MFDEGPLEDADAAMNAAKAAALFGADTSAEEESGVASGASVRRISTDEGNPEPLIPFPCVEAANKAIVACTWLGVGGTVGGV